MYSKKLMVTLFGIAVIGVAIGTTLFRKQGHSQTTVHVYTWSNYFPEQIISAFTKKTGIRVEFSYMASNEELFSKLKAGATGYDVIQPSDYMVRQMVKLNMLEPLNHTHLPHLHHIDDFYRKQTYDEDFKHSVPFTWGTTGIAVNTDKVALPKDGVGWALLYNSPDPKHTSLLDDMREVFAGMLAMQGHSINEKGPALLEKAKTEIVRVKDRVLTFSSEPKALLLKEEIYIAHIFSCDAVQAHKEKPSIQYFIPKEGGTLWTDNFAIPRTSQNKVAAHQFIDYFLAPQNALEMSLQNHLATPNKTARALLPKEITSDANLYPPPDVLKRMTPLGDLGESLQLVSRLWTELKS